MVMFALSVTLYQIFTVEKCTTQTNGSQSNVDNADRKPICDFISLALVMFNLSVIISVWEIFTFEFLKRSQFESLTLKEQVKIKNYNGTKYIVSMDFVIYKIVKKYGYRHGQADDSKRRECNALNAFAYKMDASKFHTNVCILQCRLQIQPLG